MAWFSLTENGYTISLKYLKKTKEDDLLDYDSNPFEEFDSFNTIFDDPGQQATVRKDFESALFNEPDVTNAYLVILVEGMEFKNPLPIGLCGWTNLTIEGDPLYNVALKMF